MEQRPIHQNRTSFLPAVVTGFIILCLTVYAVIATANSRKLETGLASIKSELSLAQNSLHSTKTTLSSIQSELVITKQTLTETQTELGSAKQALASARTRLISADETLVNAQSNLDSTKETLAEAQTELSGARQALADARTAQSSLNQDLVSLQLEVDTTRRQLADADQALTSTRNELASARDLLAAADTYKSAWETSQEQSGLDQQTLSALGISIGAVASYSGKNPDNVVLAKNESAVNPTYNQLMAFLARDKTELNPYNLNVYDCSQYSQDIFNHAETEGIKAGYVILRFNNGVNNYGHALNVFLTSDRGPVYIDSTNAPDKVARVEPGKKYEGVEAQSFSPDNLRNEQWWDSLTKSYHIGSADGGPTVTTTIQIYW